MSGIKPGPQWWVARVLTPEPAGQIYSILTLDLLLFQARWLTCQSRKFPHRWSWVWILTPAGVSHMFLQKWGPSCMDMVLVLQKKNVGHDIHVFVFAKLQLLVFIFASKKKAGSGESICFWKIQGPVYVFVFANYGICGVHICFFKI